MDIPLTDALKIIDKLPVVEELHNEGTVFQQRLVGPYNLASQHVAADLEKALHDDNRGASVFVAPEKGVILVTSSKERL